MNKIYKHFNQEFCYRIKFLNKTELEIEVLSMMEITGHFKKRKVRQ